MEAMPAAHARRRQPMRTASGKEAMAMIPCINCGQQCEPEENQATICEDCRADYESLDLEGKLDFHFRADLKRKGTNL